MSDIEFHFIGWNCSNNHDKVWVHFSTDGVHYCCWGRRGGKMAYKKHGGDSWAVRYNIDRLTKQKQSSGYKPVDDLALFALFPDFKENVELNLTLNTLTGKIK